MTRTVTGTMTRKGFGLGLIAAGIGAAALTRASAADAADAPAAASVPTTPSAAGQTHVFFRNSAFEYVMLSCLGRAYHQGGNVGKVLYVIRSIEDGNYDSAYAALLAAGDEARGLAEASAARGHRESARQAYLWAQNFYDSAIYFADGTGDPDRAAATWEMMDACWLKSIALFDPPIEQVKSPMRAPSFAASISAARTAGSGMA